MNNLPPKLTTSLACRVVKLDRDRFNEAIAAGVFTCAPATIPGRARVFDPDDMVALWLYRELVEDGYTRERAGRVACEVASAAREYPDAAAISLVESYFRRWDGSPSFDAFPADAVPAPQDWDSILFGGTDIRKVTTFRISKMRALIARYTAEEISTFGSDD